MQFLVWYIELLLFQSTRILFVFRGNWMEQGTVIEISGFYYSPLAHIKNNYFLSLKTWHF